MASDLNTLEHLAIDCIRIYSENSKTSVVVATNSTPNATNSPDTCSGNCDEHVSTSTIVLAVLLGVFVLATLTLAIDDIRLRLRNRSDSTLSPSFVPSNLGLSSILAKLIRKINYLPQIIV